MNMDLDAATKEAPTLTLDPFAEAKAEIVEKKPEELVEEQAVPEMELTPEEQKMVNDFAAKIDIENTNQILQYGAGTQKKMADFSDTALENVKTQDLGEIGELISNVVGELKDFDVQEEGKFFGFFRKQTSKIENLKNKYDKAQANVEKITDSLQQHQVRLMKDSAMLDKMYEQNLNYFKELTMYILAGKKKLEETRNGKLAEMKNKAALSGLPEDAQAARDLDEKCSRFEKKLHDLELTRTISLQTAPQIRLVQNSDTMIIVSVNNDTKEVRMVSVYRDTLLNVGDDTYTKANAAYALGGPEQAITMLNTNLDLDISDYATADFSALVEVVDDLGGLDIPLSYAEIEHMNNYCVETSKLTGKDYTPIEKPEPKPEDQEAIVGTYHLNGVQATSYCRIRYTASLDMGRTERQRRVIQMIVDKAKKAGLSTIFDIMDQVFPMVTTSVSKTEILKMIPTVIGYSIDETTGFPTDYKFATVKGSVIVPTTLESNVLKVHQFLYGNTNYSPTQDVLNKSAQIVNIAGDGDAVQDSAPAVTDVPNDATDDSYSWQGDESVDYSADTDTDYSSDTDYSGSSDYDSDEDYSGGGYDTDYSDTSDDYSGGGYYDTYDEYSLSDGE